jgi:hypothetical protein
MLEHCSELRLRFVFGITSTVIYVLESLLRMNMASITQHHEFMFCCDKSGLDNDDKAEYKAMKRTISVYQKHFSL